MIHQVEGIILAAGLSTRMGAQKLLVELEGRPLIMWVVRAALESELSRVTLVVSPRDEGFTVALGAVAQHPRFSRIVNPHSEQGMASSLGIGVSSVSAQSSGAMILLGDQPGITAEIINEMLRVFQGDSKSIVRASVNGRQTTPVIFPADLFQELTCSTGDVGGRFVVDRNRERVVSIEMGSRYDDSDLDTPEDLEKMALKLRSRHSQL